MCRWRRVLRSSLMSCGRMSITLSFTCDSNLQQTVLVVGGRAF